MRIAIVSDLHANLTAWKTVLADLADLKAEQIICLGDVVGYGPHPVEVLESVYSVVNVTLMGNHDAAVCGRLSTENFSPRAATAVARHRELLTATALEWLARLPLTYEGDGFRCVHSEFSEPEAFRYVVAPEDALPSWRATPEQLLFVGHSHLPGIYVIGESGVPHFVEPFDFELEEGKRYLINPGSVGYPRVGNRRSSYCIYDDAARAILFRQLPFDTATYLAAMHGTGLDDDPWVQQKAAQQHVPTLRDAPKFGKIQPRTAAPSDQRTDVTPAAGAARASSPSPRRRGRLFALVTLIAGAVLIFGLVAFRAGRANSPPPLAISVPSYDPPALAAFPLAPPDKNLLPPLPPTLDENGRLGSWRYSFEDRSRQTFSTGLRDGKTTLRIINTSACKAQVESPLINLAGTGLRKIRLRGRIRKPDPFSGTVFYQVVLYTTTPDDKLSQVAIKPFEMRTARRKLSTPGAERDVAIDLGRQITHLRFRIEADFKGTLEIEQPSLIADLKESRP
ncbi:MAG TPA: metallophosphoesterase family protein [Kiritimatiellia bacterium]|nr:metallophosphoesterase family protein [Kiritimatiellia bacterium]HRU70370.1 metallophosphoesterase family protein [Kiritimatiellia bacterium]